MTKTHLGAVGLALVLALALAGHSAPAPAQDPAGPDNGFASIAGEGCTVIIVGKDASTDGSVMTTHTCDCGICDWTFRRVPAADHKPGSTRKLYHISQYRTWPPSEGLKWDLIKKDYAGIDIPE